MNSIATNQGGPGRVHALHETAIAAFHTANANTAHDRPIEHS